MRRSTPPAQPAAAQRARLLPLPLPSEFPAAWASAYGEDRHGLWQAFEVAGVRQVMRWIPPGQFLMGSPKTEPGRWDFEHQHRVRLTQGFWLADTACTQALWLAVLGGKNPSGFNDDAQNPVEQVSWTDVVEVFMPRLNALVPELNARLPTEAQWEFACRGDAADNTPFWFGREIGSEQVNFNGTEPSPGATKSAYRKRTVPVTALPCNAWGLYQMHGNVWEWCADWYDKYPAEAVENPTGPGKQPSETAGRVLRGGSWIYGARYCRSALRNVNVPGRRNDDFGFRLARGLPPAQPAGGARPAEPGAPQARGFEPQARDPGDGAPGSAGRLSPPGEIGFFQGAVRAVQKILSPADKPPPPGPKPPPPPPPQPPPKTPRKK